MHDYYPAALDAFEDWTLPAAWAFVEAFPTPQALASAGKRRWEKFLHTHKLYRPQTVSNLAIGVAGLGEIGTEIARTLRFFGARVLGWRRSGAACEWVEQLYAGNDKRVSVRDRLHTTKLTDRAPPPPCPHRGRGPHKWGGAYCRSCCRSSVLSRP